MGRHNTKQHAADFEESARLLAYKVAGLILLTLVVFVVPLVWTVDSVLRERLVQQAQQALRQQDQQRYQSIQRGLQGAERSIERFAQLLSEHLRAPAPGDETTFNALVQRDPDGLWRSRRESFDAGRQAGIWAPDAAVARPEARSLFVQAKHLADLFGAGGSERLHANLWMLPAGNGEVIYWPNDPEFIYRVAADQDYRATEWFQSVQPPAYTSDRPRWTSTSFDPVADAWMISVIAPFQWNGQWGGSVGHDIVIQDLFLGLNLSQPQTGSEMFMLDQEQCLLMASLHQKEIEQADEPLKASELGDPERAALLQRVVEMAGPAGARRPVLLDTGEDLVTALPMEQPDWLLVTIMSRTTARAMMEAPLRWLRWGLAISMGLLILACGLVVSRDALQRLRTEQKLLAALTELEKLESFVNRSPAVVFLWRAEPGWPVEYVSENVNQFGYEASDLMSGKVVWINTLHPEDLPDLEAAVEKNREEGRRECTLTYRMYTVDQETRWVETQILMLNDGHGRLQQVQGVMLDITERQRMETELHAEQQRYQNLFNHAGAGITYFNREGCVQMINPAACQQVQREASYLKGRRLEDFLPLDQATATRERLEEGLLQPTTRTYEDAWDLPGGTRWFVSTFTTIRDAQGQALGVQVVSQDITERKRAELALRDSRERYRLIVETAQEGVWVIDQNNSTTFVNQRMADMLGFTAQEMIGKTLFDHMNEKGRRIAEENIERRKRGIKESHDFCFQRKDGTELWAIVSTNPLMDAEGNYQGALALITDITDRRRAEQDRHHLETRIQQAQKLESLGIMAAGIAHDFNNLLQTILGHAELALQDAPEKSPQKESLREIFKAAQRAGAISNQMTTYVGQGSFQRSSCALENLLHELRPTLNEVVAQRALFTMDCSPELPPAWVDAAEFKKSVLHLVTNAVESLGPSAGRIALNLTPRTWRRSELQELLGAPELSEGDYLTLTVTDNGNGIDRATMAHLFEPFFTTKFPGRGLGLMQVLGFVRGHGGGIRVDSKPGHGTTVTLLLPMAPAEKPVTPAMPWGWRGQGTLLMVDDEAAILAVGRRTLTELGFTVLTAGDGQEAMEVYRQHHDAIRCVILDLVMPGQDGVQTLAALHELNPQLPVIIATAYPVAKAIEMLAGQLYSGLIHKPYTGAVLARQLQSLLG